MQDKMAASEFDTRCPTRRQDVASRLVDGEMVVLDREHGFVHQLNRTATLVWEQCDGEHTAAQIASQMCENFEVDRSTALNDVVKILNELRKLALVRNEEQTKGKEI
jgi:hypothetical protein